MILDDLGRARRYALPVPCLQHSFLIAGSDGNSNQQSALALISLLLVLRTL